MPADDVLFCVKLAFVHGRACEPAGKICRNDWVYIPPVCLVNWKPGTKLVCTLLCGRYMLCGQLELSVTCFFPRIGLLRFDSSVFGKVVRKLHVLGIFVTRAR